MLKTVAQPTSELLEHVKKLDYPTPYFFTSKKILKQNYETFHRSFRSSEVYYALKANSDLKILEYLNQLGCGFEAASSYEIELLNKLGVKPKKITYGTSVKPSAHILYAHNLGVDRFAADSKEEIEKIAAQAKGAKVFVRVVVNDSGSVFTMSERFGAPVETAKNLLVFAKQSGLVPYGISFYVGSQATTAERWGDAVKHVRPVFESLLEEGIRLDTLNIGGGFPVEYQNHANVPTLDHIVNTVHKAMDQLPYEPKVMLEPGRGIVASSTVLVAEVIAKSNRAGKPWLVLDAGIYNALYEAMVHQGRTQYKVHPIHPTETKQKTVVCTLAGPTGDSLDIITRQAELPAHIGVGDKLVFENAGAYSISMASPFNGFPMPKLYLS